MISVKLAMMVVLAGTGRSPERALPVIGGVRISGKTYVSIPVLVARNNLRLIVNEKAGIYVLLDSGHRVVIVPGFRVAEVDGRAVRMVYPAIFSNGQLMVPAHLFNYVRREFRKPEGSRIPLTHVLIDAGHGGHDSGAVGLKRLCEKDVALGVSIRLRNLLRMRGVRVSMTRERDHYVKLRERSAIANRSGADLFISIHCNAATNRSARGVEAFALSPGISDGYRASKAASRHRPTDLIAGAANHVGISTEKAIFRAHMGEQRLRSRQSPDTQ